MMKHLISCTAIAVGIGISTLAATSAQAYTLNSSLNCNAGSITGYTQCAGSYELGGSENDVTNGGANNIATKLLNNDDIFSVGGGWTFGNKYDGGMTGSNSNGFSVSGLGSTSGSFGFGNLDLSKNDIAVSLKSGKGFSLYYIKAGSITDPSQIQWNTQGTSVNRRGRAQGLSHISYFTRLVDTTPVGDTVRRVPEPTAVSALFAVGSAAMLRRKKKHTT